MERALNGTKMGGYRLKVNLAKFATENEGLHGEVPTKDKGKSKVIDKQPQVNNIFNHAYVNNEGGKSFKDLFTGSNGGVGESSYPKHNEDGTGSMISKPDDTLAFKEIMGKALVGRCRDLTTLRTLNVLLAGSDLQGVSLSYIGGLSMLLKFVDESVCTDFLLNHSVWDPWFSSLDNWNGQSLPFEMLAWVRVQGLLIHLADNKVFDSIAGQFGKIVHGSQITADDNNLSASWIGVLVGVGDRIQEHRTVCWKKKQFHVWIEEELSEWIPDSVGEMVSRGKEEEVRPDKGINDDVVGMDKHSPEIRQPTGINEGTEVLGEENILGNFNQTVNVVGDVSISQNVGVQENLRGAQDNDERVTSCNNSIYYFISADNSGRPKRKASRIRPKNRATTQTDCASPSSENRPKKRSREDGDSFFAFDLNKNVAEE
ncbi:hypothetical protein HanLR1_Chr13g0476951 [Helianthus annuus]|nr:hypothetical protein HanLR1_Chr13g0476951 [Helianthus annuus]